MGLFLIPFSIFLNLTLIPIMGIDGAAWAATVTNIVGGALAGGYIYIRFNALVNFASVARILLSSIIIYLIAVFYPAKGFMLFANYMILSVVFFFLLILFKEITREDISAVKDKIFRIMQREKVTV
jgi:Na+-driven multidrug efflux pump